MLGQTFGRGCHYVVMTFRSHLAKDIIASAETLSDCYRLPHISESHLVLLAEAWDVLADIELLQANLAGSLTWEPNAGGTSLLDELRQECATLRDRASGLGLSCLASRLQTLGDLLTSARR